MYDSLLKITPDGSYEPMLATKWKYSDENTKLHLDLREGVTFTDGAPFDGKAVKANLEAVKNGTGVSAAAFASVESIDVESATKVTLELSEPDPGLIRQLALPGGMMASPAALGTDGLKATPVGSGPYILDTAKSTATVEYVFNRNPDYWDAKAMPFDTLILKPVLDPTARLNAVRSGQADGAAGDAINIAEAKSAGLTVTESPGPGFQGLFILDRDGSVVPELGNLKVRQAINYAIDSKGILNALFDGKGTQTGQVFNPLSTPWDDSLNNAYPYDPKQAKKLLAEAGYPNGFTLPMPEPFVANLTPILEQQLADVGITVQYITVAPQERYAEFMSGKYGMVWYQLQSSDPWQGINFWGAENAPWNPRHSTTPAIANAIEKIKVTSGEKQVAAYRELSKTFIAEAWFAPSFFPDAVYFSSKNVTVEPQALQIVPSIYNYKPVK